MSREDVLAVACPACTAAPGSTLGQVGEPCCDVGGGRVQMVCLARIAAARATPQTPAAAPASPIEPAPCGHASAFGCTPSRCAMAGARPFAFRDVAVVVEDWPHDVVEPRPQTPVVDPGVDDAVDLLGEWQLYGWSKDLSERTEALILAHDKKGAGK